MGDISAGRRRTCLSASTELISYDHVGLGAAVDACGQVAEISIFNDINNLVLKGQGVDRWTVMCEHRFSIYD